MESENEYQYQEEGSYELGTARETAEYRHELVNYLSELSVYYENLMSFVLRGKNNEELINACISKMVNVMAHILPKLEGAGDSKSLDLLKEFEPFRKWIFNPSIPKTNMTESNKIPELYVLIIRAFHLLGVTNL